MPVVKVLRNHVYNGSVRRVGTTYDVPESQAAERIRLGLVALTELIDFVPPGLANKAEYAMYAPRQFRVPESEVEEEPAPTLIRRAGNWWFFSDDVKVLGQAAAAEKLGITVEEFMRDHAPSFA
jgi:hypothetical protein